MEMSSRRILYESNGDTRLPMASTTKIVTALTVLENCEDLHAEMVIPNEAVGIEGSSVYLQEGDIYTVKELLFGLMLRSGNDCATALALRFADNIGDFAVKMNKVAQKAAHKVTPIIFASKKKKGYVAPESICTRLASILFHTYYALKPQKLLPSLKRLYKVLPLLKIF